MFKSLLLQTLFFLSVFFVLTWYRESNMLSTDVNVTQELEDTQLLTLAGEKISLNKPNKNTLVYFFAPWCGVCNFSIENLESVYRKKKDLHIVAVALDYMSDEDVKEFVNRHDLTVPIALGTETTKNLFKVTGYPSYYVIDKQNKIKAKSLGFSSEIGLLIRTL